MDVDGENDLADHSLPSDQQDSKLTLAGPNWVKKQSWKPLFFTKDLLKEHEVLRLEDFALKDRHLRRLGKQVTNDRQRIVEVAR